ncbi:SDR family oxidoreductase [Actinophytocola sp. NPDC049390]|uniref:SDR family oxidoreductase n=1 Tax=Actinophytocola sp. NPDC049390 TaxID=3363894 RepID=UPI0037B10BCE
MRITLRHNSDRLALLTGRPRLLSLRYSADPAIVSRALPRRADDERKTVLLLGGNGFVGIHFLHDLLDDERVEKVYALVRPKGTNSGVARIARQARKYKMALPESDKLVVLEGSYLDPSFGQDEATYEELLSQVDVVIDAAGGTTHEYPYARYRREKVLPTITLAEFCLTRRYKTLHVIGSVGSEVYTKLRDFYRPSFFFCGYSKMKYVVKHLSLTMNRAGVPINVYQAPFALGGPGTRFKDPGMEYSFWNMVWHMVQQGRTYQFGGTNPMVAGDVLARAVLNNALSPAPRPISYPVTPVTNELLAERFGLDLVPYKEFRRGLVRANRFRVGEVKWRNPISSTRREWQRASFVRSLFPRCLPTLLTDIDKAVQAPAVPLNAGIPAIDVLEANARNIRKIAKDLPVRATEDQVAAPRAAA